MSERGNFFTVAQIGQTREVTAQGFLLCRHVRLARTGFQQYRAGEIPVSPGPNGFIEIERSADEVFHPVSLASFNGAPFVDEHPWEDVTPQNWRALAGGFVLNPRRGEGEDGDGLFGDILVTAPELIEAINAGKREVSVGYECDYDELEPGRGRQRNIIVNHVALVRQGRCGVSCAIKDHAPQEPEPMTTATRKPAKGLLSRSLQRLRAAVTTKDNAAIEEALSDTEQAADLVGDEGIAGAAPASPEHHVHLHMGDEFPPRKDDDEGAKKKEDEKTEDEANPFEARLAAVEASIGEIKALVEKVVGAEQAEAAAMATTDEKVLGELKMEAPPGTNDSAMTKDSAFLQPSFVDTVATAEILAPGIQAPTFDAKLPPVKTFDSICGHRRAAMKAVLASPSGNNATVAQFINSGLRGFTVDTMTCGHTRELFRAAGALKATVNNGSRTADVHLGAVAAVGSAKTPRELNAIAAKHYGKA